MQFNALNPRHTTPTQITTEIEYFFNEIVPSDKPVFVSVEPEHNSRVDHCFFNVPEKVALHGGSMQYGWIIWETPRILLDAEFHAVWRSPKNSLIDVSPKPDGEKRILFLSDANRVWEKEPVNNIRRPLIDNAYVRRLIRFSEAKFDLQKRHYVYGESVQIPQSEVAQLINQLGLKSEEIDRLVGRNDPCPCGSGKKYKKCGCLNK